MRALAYFGPGKVKVVKKPDPRLEHPQDVILKRDPGRDLRLGPPPAARARPRHARGLHLRPRVHRGGRGGRAATSGRCERGDRVVVPFNISCGRCFFCERGLFGNCENTNPSSNDIASGVFGYSHTTGGFEGGQAEYVRVPFADVGPDADSRRHGGRGRPLPQRRPPHRLPGRGDGGDREGRDGRRLRLGAGRALRPALGVADGRRPGDRGGPGAGAARTSPASTTAWRRSTSTRWTIRSWRSGR